MLSCRAIAGIPSPTVIWQRRDRAPMSLNAKEEYPGTILISNLTFADAGQYECKASNAVGETSQGTAVTVQQPPIIRIIPDQIELSLTEGDELKLECLADGLPAPSVLWRTPDSLEQEAANLPGLRGLPGPHEFSRAIFHKYNVGHSDAGTYVCRASNEAGEEQKYITIDITPKRGDVGKFNVVKRLLGGVSDLCCVYFSMLTGN